MKKLKAFTIAIVMGLLLNSCSNNKTENKSGIVESPAANTTLPAPIQNLMKFLGKWDADATFTIEGKAYKVVHSLNGTKTADGNGLSMEEWFTHPELGSMKGANLAGFDPFDSKIHWFSVDNMGTTHEHIGEWVTPDHLYVEHNGMRDGKNFIEKIDMTFKGADQMDLKLIATLDGKEVQRAEGIYYKKASDDKK